MIEGYMTTKEAASYLGYDPDSICYLCVKGKLSGAIKFGKAWAIPEQSVREYTKGLQGFALVKAKKDTARQLELDELNAAIRCATGQKEAVRP